MIKHLLKDISEKDFRELNLKVYRHKIENGHSIMKEYALNDILDSQIKMALDSGRAEDLYDLLIPVSIAIHEENNDEYSGYLDKFMNRFTGLQTFQIGWGIHHLYSTRDYYEAHEDYWRVLKRETAIIYRVHLEPRDFILKHKKEIVKKINDDEWYETMYDLNEETGEWVEAYTSHIIREGQRTTILPVSKEEKIN